MQFNKSLMTAALLAVSSLAVVSANAANTTTGSFDVKITIQKTCNVAAAVGTNNILFGEHIAGSTTNLQGTAAAPIKVNCSKGTPYKLGLTSTKAAANATGLGVMKGPAAGTEEIGYQLRQATGATGAVWGNTGANLVSGSGTGMSVAEVKNHTVYATVTGSSDDVTPGDYSDTVNVLMTY